jgi:hypothetical protein
VTSCIVDSAATYIMVVKFRNTIWPPSPQLSLHRRAALSINSNGTRSVYSRENPKRSLYCEMSMELTDPLALGTLYIRIGCNILIQLILLHLLKVDSYWLPYTVCLSHQSPVRSNLSINCIGSYIFCHTNHISDSISVSTSLATIF